MDTKASIKNFFVVIFPAFLTVFIIFFLVMPKVRQGREVIETPVEGENSVTQQEEVLIGGDRDEHGCLGPAGYTWNEEAGACLREWEIKDEGSKKAIKIAVEHLGWENDTTVIELIVARCPGCFTVKLENNLSHERQTVNIDNWEVSVTSLTPVECEELGGTELNTVGGATCAEDEENAGEVTGFISPNICCVPK